MKKYKLARCVHLSKCALAILKCGLPLTAAVLVYTAFTYASLDTFDAARMYGSFCLQIEHALMSLLLTVSGALLLDIESKRHS